MVAELKGSSSCWIKLEGRNHEGLSQFRWVSKEWPLGERFKYAIVFNNPVDEYYEDGKKWHGKGYDRISLNVFIDGSGTVRYQAIWISPAKPKDSVIKSSVLADDSREFRERAFTSWESASEAVQLFEDVKSDKSVLYLETRENNETRVIYSNKSRFKFYTRWWCGELLFLRHHKEYTMKGYKLLTISISERDDFSKIYSGVWVADDDFSKAQEELESLGISLAQPITLEEVEKAQRK